MINPGKMLLDWWRNASARARWFAGIALFSSFCTVALILISDSVGSTPTASSTPGMDVTPWDMLGVTAKLLFVLALIAVGAVLLRRFAGKQGFRRAKAQIEVVETVRLSPRQAMHVVRAGHRYLLVGATDQALSLITDLGNDYQAVQPEGTGEIKAGTAEDGPEQEKTFQDVLSSLTARPK